MQHKLANDGASALTKHRILAKREIEYENFGAEDGNLPEALSTRHWGVRFLRLRWKVIWHVSV